MAKIYVAGKNMDRAEAVMKELVAGGHTITYDWVSQFTSGPTAEKSLAEANAVRESDILVYLWEIDQESARYEAGMAMGLEKKIVVSGKSDAFFFQLPFIYCVENDKSILKKVNELA